MKVPKFSEWVQVREDCSRPEKPSKMKKIKDEDEISAGTRDAKKDLSADYKGNISHMGSCEPFKCLGKGGKSAAEVPK